MQLIARQSREEAEEMATALSYSQPALTSTIFFSRIRKTWVLCIEGDPLTDGSLEVLNQISDSHPENSL